MDGASFVDPPPGKVNIFAKTFGVGYRLPTTNFLDDVLHKNGANIYELTPNNVTKILAFEMFY